MISRLNRKPRSLELNVEPRLKRRLFWRRMRKGMTGKLACPRTPSGQKDKETLIQKNGNRVTSKCGEPPVVSVSRRRGVKPCTKAFSLTFTRTFHRISCSPQSYAPRLAPENSYLRLEAGNLSLAEPVSPPLYSNYRAPVKAEAAAF